MGGINATRRGAHSVTRLRGEGVMGINDATRRGGGAPGPRLKGKVALVPNRHSIYCHNCGYV